VLAALVQSRMKGRGAHIQTSLLEALIDFQFEVLATYLNDGGRSPQRAHFRNAHAYLSAPYGVYRTADTWLALAMTPLDKLAPLLEMPELADLPPDAPFRQRDPIKREIAETLAKCTTAEWLARLQPHDIWCSEVLDWSELFASENFRLLDMVQELSRGDGVSLRTMRSPIRVDGQRGRSQRAAPRIGEHNEALRMEFGL
jgi:crotonobetainyl-CoA:carnitine CoA-transferase CaiB-like acyl-CoA transferase